MTAVSHEITPAADLISGEVAAVLERSAPRVAELALAGVPTTMRVAESLASLLFTPFAHLERGEGRAELRIMAAPLTDEVVERLGLHRLGENGAVQVDGDRVVHLLRDSAAVLDRKAGTIHALFGDEATLPAWQRAKPLQLLLSIFLADRDIDLVHAGFVARNGEGILIAGATGAGKSTVALSALTAGFDYLSDDCIALGREGRALSIFGCGCLEWTHLGRFPRLSATAAPDRKGTVRVAALFPSQMATSGRVRAVVLPRVTGGDDVTVTRVSGAEALLALAPSSVVKRAVPAAATLARMAALLRSVPAFRLEMGPLDRIAPRLAELLEAQR